MKSAILFVASLLAVGGLAAGGAAPETNVPGLTCERPVFDFGEMDNRETVEHVFVIKNISANSIEVTRIWSGCPCASASLGGSNILGGAQAGLLGKVVLQSRAGKQRKSFYIHYNDSTQRLLQVEMTGNAIPWLEIGPERLDFGNIEKDARETREARVSWKVGEKHTVTNVTATLPCMAVEATPSDRGSKIIARTVPPLPPGILRGSVVALTDDPTCPRVEIPVVVMAVGDIVVVPAELCLGDSGKAGWATSKYLALRSRSGKRFTILGVEPPAPGIKCQITAMGAHGYRLELPSCSLQSDIGGAELRIRTDLLGSEELVVPFVTTSPARRK